MEDAASLLIPTLLFLKLLFHLILILVQVILVVLKVRVGERDSRSALMRLGQIMEVKSLGKKESLAREEVFYKLSIEFALSKR